MTSAEAKRLIGSLLEMYPREVVTDGRLNLYAALLADIPVELGAAAVAHWLATEEFFPSPAKFRALCAELSGTLAPDVDEAWSEVRKEIRRVGWSGKPRWTHDAIAEAVRAIGWDTLCGSTNGAIDRAHFQRFYAAAAKRVRTAAQTSGAARALVPAVQHVLETGEAPPNRRALPGSRNPALLPEKGRKK